MAVIRFFLILLLVGIISCASSVKIIKNQAKFYEKNIEIEILDIAEIKLPFEPTSVKIFSTDIMKVEREKNIITIKAIGEGNGSIALIDNDGVRIGYITVIVKE